MLALVFYTMFPGFAIVPPHAAPTRLERLGLIVAVSIATNAFAIMLLSVLGVYTHQTAWLWTSLVLMISVLASRRRQQSGLSAPQARPLLGQTAFDAGMVIMLLPLLAITAYKSCLFPFVAWDAIASWNRWARNYVLSPEYFLSHPYFYTQYNSWSMSFPYMLMNNTAIEYYSHALGVAYLFVLYAGIARLARILRAPHWLALSFLFLSYPIPIWVGSGYADDAAMAFTTLAIALFIESLLAAPGLSPWKRSLLAGGAAGTAFMYKQSAALMTVSIPILAAILMTSCGLTRRIGRAALVAAGMTVVALPWLLAPNTTLFEHQLKFVTHDIHGAQTRWEVFRSGMQSLVAWWSIFEYPKVDATLITVSAAAVLVAVWRNRVASVLAIAALLAVATWAATANYDMRGLMPAIPIITVLVASGFNRAAASLRAPSVARAFCLLVHTAAVATSVIGAWAGLHLERHHHRIFDRRPDLLWNTVSPFASAREKIECFYPAVRGLTRWQREHPHFSGHFCSDPLLTALVDPNRVDGGALSLLGLFASDGRVLLQKGDVLFIASHTLDGVPAPPTAVPNATQPAETWDQWLSAMVNRGYLRVEGPYGDYMAYEVVAGPQ